MSTFVALLRGINVGGHGKLPMKELVAELEKLGLGDVRTYIQSGNAVFTSRSGRGNRLADRIASAIAASHGFRPHVIVLSLEDFRAAVGGSPFPKTDAQAKTVHLFFLAEVPGQPDLEVLEAARAADERFSLQGAVLYLHAPSGIGRSKLAQSVERALGVATTARNWRTVNAILGLAESAGA